MKITECKYLDLLIRLLSVLLYYLGVNTVGDPSISDRNATASLPPSISRLSTSRYSGTLAQHRPTPFFFIYFPGLFSHHAADYC